MNYKKILWPCVVCAALLIGGVIGFFARQPEIRKLNDELATVKAVSASKDQSVEENNKKARDIQRQVDINSLATFTEVYYNDHNGYPILAQIQDDEVVAKIFPGISLEALRTPSKRSNSMVGTAQPSADQYGYITFEADGTTPCAKLACPQFKLYWFSEVDGKVYSKASLN